MTPSAFVAALPAGTRSYLRAGGSGEGWGDDGLEIRLDVWAAHFRRERFRDGWLDFGFGQGDIVPPDDALVETIDAFVANQHQSLAEILPAFFPTISMLRENITDFAWDAAFDGPGRPAHLLRVISPNVIHANQIEPRAYMIGASFLTDWEYPIGFLFKGGAVIAVGEQLAETTWMAQAAADGTLTLEDAYWLA